MYKCQMPECDYVCEDKSQIHSHHITPVSMGGSNDKSNLLDLCPNCHHRVYIPEMDSGIHALKHYNSVIFIGKLFSTAGYVIEYKNINDDDTRYHLLT